MALNAIKRIARLSGTDGFADVALADELAPMWASKGCKARHEGDHGRPDRAQQFLRGTNETIRKHSGA